MPLPESVLIANRGEIACRIIRTCRELGVRTVAVFSEADAESPHARLADVAVGIGPAAASESYLDQQKLLQVAADTGAQAIHPGYGFLSENAAFAEAVEAAGLIWIGPTADNMRRFGLKHEARALAAANEVPLLAGTDLLADVDAALDAADDVGYPVMLKSTAGGGGIGMKVCRNAKELGTAFAAVQRQAQASFGQAGCFIERFIERARHVEVQVVGSGDGRVLALGERDCSLQRRNQKVIEETPAPNLPTATRAAMLAAAERLCAAADYRSAGTVEYVYDDERDEFAFLEVNTRLQVEHGVTELVTGVDLVAWMLRIAGGDTAMFDTPAPEPQGHAIQARIYAEDPARDFQPSSGRVTRFVAPPDCRCDTWLESGILVSPHYDPLLAKVQVLADDRTTAIDRLEAALGALRVDGITSNRHWLRALCQEPTLRAGRVTTRFANDVACTPPTIEVRKGGTQTTIQDHPGRGGAWDVGVPPSGPMDDRSFRIANRIVGNPAGTAGLECTVDGPTLCFHRAATVAVTGAPVDVRLDGEPVAMWEPIAVPAGGELAIGRAREGGVRSYLAVRGGLPVPAYLGSRSTFTLGGFGGHGGRALAVGDQLPLADDEATDEPVPDLGAPQACPPELRPDFKREWQVAVLLGPHAAPDFFTDEDIATFFSTDWEVHFNSARTGVRLIGPKPQWAREDGGEAGLHPSNIHDNAYAIGAIDFTGDMPVILGPDGPSLGGFVCPATIIRAELWKMGQFAPGDRIRFVRVDPATAQSKDEEQLHAITHFAPPSSQPVVDAAALGADDPILVDRPAPSDEVPHLRIRRSGDDYLLIEYGELVLDLALRLRVHLLHSDLQQRQVPGVLDLTPGVRSLQIHFDPLVTSMRALIDLVLAVDAELPAGDDVQVPSRVVHLPLSWDDPATQLAIQRYVSGVRPDAPWCPSNIEFIRRINGLDSIQQVFDTVFAADYLVLGLGDVYLGAPLATPLDPRHRLVTTKYNPARTWTPENAVGIGGAYLCIYGMEGPGGYQFVGRTLPIWNTWRQTASFRDGKPWLLRFFDRIRFHLVDHDTLMEQRAAFRAGRHDIQIDEGTFDFGDYRRFLDDNAASIAAFRTSQRQAFAEERERWAQAGLDEHVDEALSADSGAETPIPDGHEAACAEVPGNLWQVPVQEGDTVQAGDTVAIVESMKTEFHIDAPIAGTVRAIRSNVGDQVAAGQAVVVIEPA